MIERVMRIEDAARRTGRDIVSLAWVGATFVRTEVRRRRGERIAPPMDRETFDASMRRISEKLSGDVVGMLMWTHPSTGQMWIAPLGTETPDPDSGEMSAAWLPIRIMR